MSWRETSRAIIAKVLADMKGQADEQVKKALREAYPFGQREHHPYKIWLDEIQIQTGKRRFGIKRVKPNPDQKEIF